MNEQPWLEKKAWRENEIFSNAKSGFVGLWIIATIWNLVLVAVYFKLPEILAEAKEKPIIYVFGTFPLIGLFLIWSAIKQTHEWFTLGRTPLAMDPFPGSIGGHIGGKVKTNLKYAPLTQATVSIQCLHSRIIGSGKNRRRTETVIWQNTGQSHQGQSERGAHFQFRFDVPDNLPESDIGGRSSSYHLWRLTLDIKTERNQKITRHFVVPVFATSVQSMSIRHGTEDNEATKAAAQSGLESIADIKITQSGLEISFPAFRRIFSGVFLLLFGLIFSAVGVLVVRTGASIIFLVFLVLGVIIGLCGLYSLGKSLHVSAAPEGIKVSRFLFGIPLSTHRIPRENLVGLELRKTGSTKYKGQVIVDYTLVASSVDGGKHTVAERLTSRPELELIKEKLQSALG